MLNYQNIDFSKSIFGYVVNGIAAKRSIIKLNFSMPSNFNNKAFSYYIKITEAESLPCWCPWGIADCNDIYILKVVIEVKPTKTVKANVNTLGQSIIIMINKHGDIIHNYTNK